jgi:sulfur carrier protein
MSAPLRQHPDVNESATQPLRIYLNGQAVPLSSRTTLGALLSALGQNKDGVATAVNGEFVAREDRLQCVLNAGDSVTVFSAIVGG